MYYKVVLRSLVTIGKYDLSSYCLFQKIGLITSNGFFFPVNSENIHFWWVLISWLNGSSSLVEEHLNSRISPYYKYMEHYLTLALYQILFLNNLQQNISWNSYTQYSPDHRKQRALQRLVSWR